MFGRFLDTWVVDRVLFEYVNQGGCGCCGFNHAGMGLQDFMALCSDVETDDGKKQKLSPFPAPMQEEMWADRVKFRKSMKGDMAMYKERVEVDGAEFVEWWYSISPEKRRSVFVMPKEELQVIFNTKYDFKPAYATTLCAIVEQVQKFDATGYKADGATDCEIYLEEHLVFKRGAWVIKEEYYSTDEGCDMFFGMLMQLGGDHLMPKRPKELREESEEARKAAEDAAGRSNMGPTFRGDRRLVRLQIFRYFANIAWRKFERFRAAEAAKVTAVAEEETPAASAESEKKPDEEEGEASSRPQLSEATPPNPPDAVDSVQ